MVDSPVQLLADCHLAGRYQLTRLLGRGGMAQVWEAQDDVLARAVAVKVLHPHLAVDPDFLERFRREAIAAARIHSPHVVATYDAGTHGGRRGELDRADSDLVMPFIVMELVRGRNLRQLLTETGPLPLDRAVSVAIQVCDAVAAAHAVGLIHRDVKPANILLCEEPPFVVTSPLIKVTDFGVARMTDTAGSDLTRTGMLVGTAAYLSPEQVEGRAGDVRSDVYSVGVVLHEMICGAPPYRGETELATALQHIQASPPSLRQRRAGVPPALEAIVLRAMARQPEDRYQTAIELRDALAAVEPNLAADGAISLVEPFPTPPHGQAPALIAARHSPAQPSHAHRGPVLVLASGVAAVALVVALLASGGNKPSARRAGASTPPTAARSSGAKGTVAPIAGVFLLDNPGSDNATELANAVDGNPGTMWMSSYYASSRFGNLKDGIGVILNLGQSRRLEQLTVDTPTTGWAASVYVGQQPAETLASWGAPVTSATAIDGTHTFVLGGQVGGAVLLWITTPGDTAEWANRMGIQELTVTAA
jgi:serine/threonine-protein kinase